LSKLRLAEFAELVDRPAQVNIQWWKALQDAYEKDKTL